VATTTGGFVEDNGGNYRSRQSLKAKATSNHRGAAATFPNESAATILDTKETVTAMTGSFVDDDGGNCQFRERSKDALNHNVQINRLLSRVEHLKASQKLLVVKHSKKIDVVNENLSSENKVLVTH
jgi:hypothetical protein